jgi:hydroxymethylpyrimidine pyrophosphatase-like HAD family hydrolase
MWAGLLAIVQILPLAQKQKVHTLCVPPVRFCCAGTHRFLDLLPVRAGKGAAMHWVRARLGLDLSTVVACGDSMNDLQMLELAPHAIVVSNAVPEIIHWAQQQGQEQRQQNQGGHKKIVYVASKPAAAGVLEGLHRLGFTQAAVP